MTKLEMIEKKAKELLSNQPLADLLDEWEMTTNAPDSEQIYTLRGWLMDEFASRNPEGFNAWLDQDLCYDHDLRKFMTA